MIDAFRRIGPNGWRCLVAGRALDDSIERFKPQSEGLPIEFIGFADPKTFLTDIDVLIVPSFWAEPSPRTIYEAYMMGVPCIGARSGRNSRIDWGTITMTGCSSPEMTQILRKKWAASSMLGAQHYLTSRRLSTSLTSPPQRVLQKNISRSIKNWYHNPMIENSTACEAPSYPALAK